MPFSAYLSFVAVHRRLAAFGFVITLGSSFGQTYFIGVFGPHVERDLGLSHTEWGGVYMLGTLCSALVLPFSGKLIDQLPLRRYTLLVGIGLAVGCLCLASASSGFALVLAIFMLRQCGQGLMTHVSMTTMARCFDAARGRAIAIATLGFPTGEALLPIAAVILIDLAGWRAAYGMFSLLLLLGLLPLALWLLKGQPLNDPQPAVEADHETRTARPRSVNGSVEKRRAMNPNRRGPGVEKSDVTAMTRHQWSRAEVLRDRAFWFMMPGVLAPSVIVTALFFHHLNIAGIKGWSPEWITGCYLVYACASVATMLMVGPLTDRYGASRVFPHTLWPLAGGVLILSLGVAPWLVVPYLALLGVSTGIGQTSGAAVWAELYGVRHLGAIRALVIALRVFASALGPIVMGWMLDVVLPVNAILAVFAAAALIGGVCLTAGLRNAAGRREPYSIHPVPPVERS